MQHDVSFGINKQQLEQNAESLIEDLTTVAYQTTEEAPTSSPEVLEDSSQLYPPLFNAPYSMQPEPSFFQQVQQWIRTRTPEQWGYLGIFVLAAFLRLWSLGDKPVHHDESLHAYYSWTFLGNPASYLYDPLLHGPFQFHVIPIFFMLGRLFGLSGQGANDFTVRLLPALMGLAMVALPYWLRAQLGRWGALSLAFVLAISPSFVYYSRFVRDDIYVVCFTLLLLVAAIQYSQTRKLRWLLIGAAALTLSYTAMENTFFVIAVFGSYLAALVLWDLGPWVGSAFKNAFAERDRPLAGRVMVLVPFGIIMALLALIGLHWLGQLSTTINDLAATHKGATDPLNPDVTIQTWENNAVTTLLIASVVIALSTVAALLIQLQDNNGEIGQRTPPRWRTWLDPRQQPVLDTLLNTHWLRWFAVFVVAWILFAAFFWKLPTDPYSLSLWGDGFKTGIGRGLLQGIYYWLEQQHVARGNQPWYYYFILIPLYEPLILAFGLGGILRALIQPSRFRLFLVYWFGFNLALYSWAGEKMPWLIVHILLPLALLAAVALEWVLVTVVQGVRSWWTPTRFLIAIGIICLVAPFALMSVPMGMGMMLTLLGAGILCIGVATALEQWQRRQALREQAFDALTTPPWQVHFKQIGAAGCLVVAVLLLLPTVWNMREVAFVEPSVAPNEMLIYVQTTTDVQTTMNKIAALDKIKTGGKHTLRIGVTGEATWPFVWYLHDYTYVYYQYTPNSGGDAPDVIIADIGSSSTISTTYPTQFASKQYRLRWWWDESYKLPLCSTTKTSQCSTTPTWDTGVGPFLWITYGAYPPTKCNDPTQAKCDRLNDPFNGGKAAQRYWSWLWQRQPISGTQPGSTDFMLYINNDLANQVAP
jgi:uncharacterized protein (TIGR03663 family)